MLNRAQRIPLPIDRYEAAIKQAFGAPQLLIKASPGSGKTTRLPPFIANLVKGKIIVLEPRRLAAKMSALRVREENLDPTEKQQADFCGWSMRFDHSFTSQTKINFLTEGLYLARLASDVTLHDVDCVIIDEVHERHLETDLALALTLELQKTTRQDLKIILMSASVDLSTLSKLMPDGAIIDIEAPRFDVAIGYDNVHYDVPLPQRMAQSITKILQKDLAFVFQTPDQNDLARNVANDSKGHILAFLPGTKSILDTKRALTQQLSSMGTSVDNPIDILELRSTISAEDQALIFRHDGRRKIILSTNIAESALTIPGVRIVVDSGLARVPVFDHEQQRTSLVTQPISKSSLIQRAGRAGRTQTGLVVRLFSRHEFDTRPDQDKPEIERIDPLKPLLSLMLLSRSLKRDIPFQKLSWVTPPDEGLWSQSQSILSVLKLDQLDDQLLAAPLDPRVMRFFASIVPFLPPESSALLAWIVQDEASELETPKNSEAYGCDLMARFYQAKQFFWRHQDKKALDQLASIAKKHLIKTRSQPTQNDPDVSTVSSIVERALLDGYFDKVALAKEGFLVGRPRAYTLASGEVISLQPQSSAIHSHIIVLWSLSAQRQSSSVQSVQTQFLRTTTLGTGATTIDLETLKKHPLCQKFLLEETIAKWDDDAVRFKGQLITRYMRIGIDQRFCSLRPEITRPLFEKKLAEIWPKPFPDEEPLRQYCERTKRLHKYQLLSHSWNPDDLKPMLIATMADEAQSLNDVLQRSLKDWILTIVGYGEFDAVKQLAPDQIKIGAGFMTDVHYPEGQPPFIAARLQNFFGQEQTPSILSGKEQLTIHLLAPNQRPIQITNDLKSFWSNAYPTMRQEYMRKYPRHEWPENPRTAAPPDRGSMKSRPKT
jgi:ATP-dependent helicase HrpB